MSAPLPTIKPLTRARFNALCYKRRPLAAMMSRETEWWSDEQERVLGLVLLDLSDDDWVWIVLGRDEQGLFRAIDVQASIPTQAEARTGLHASLAKHAQSGAVFPQEDNSGRRHEIFRVQVPATKLHRHFPLIATGDHHAAARRMMEELALAFVDIDGNYAKDFQTTGFNARLWELALFAFLHEQQFTFNHEHDRPDFLVDKHGKSLAIEATTVNPTDGETPPNPSTREEVELLRRDFMPVKFGSALYSKLQKKYWELDHVKGLPVVLAVHDFCGEGSMTWSSPALSDYLYGTRATARRLPNGALEVTETPVAEHSWGTKRIPSGFFNLPGAEHISAVLFSNSATVAKFNRMGVLAGFGLDNIRIHRAGARHDPNPNAAVPIPFLEEVVPGTYDEDWTEGMQLFHNPRAAVPVLPALFPGCAHHTFNGRNRVAALPVGFIHNSTTHVARLVPD
ncbi:glycosaminoglycan attachment protein [Oleiharenicola lentus]|uniref:Glycosaminoglycan attachment protein n=1 Tax=Oleiharenicola lentus TaxID=2508720 RepID=A0A4Q1C514_9BACT|nr:glycosaminoglycan attachment protein [Oleiharenicola lentus]RXK53471.1 glycosaminoglycan attachment protein [Oleiharenicola lentus]